MGVGGLSVHLSAQIVVDLYVQSSSFMISQMDLSTALIQPVKSTMSWVLSLTLGKSMYLKQCEVATPGTDVRSFSPPSTSTYRSVPTGDAGDPTALLGFCRI